MGDDEYDFASIGQGNLGRTEQERMWVSARVEFFARDIGGELGTIKLKILAL
jgi:hypothetical protein